jgi:biopolymer transport protein ExbD
MMVVAPLLDQQGISLSVPENVEAEKIEKEPLILTVYVSAADKYFINNEEVAPDMLGTILAQEIKNYPDGMLIKTDSDSTHGALVKLMDKARYAGVKAISIDKI